jgi:hypothetical protein
MVAFIAISIDLERSPHPCPRTLHLPPCRKIGIYRPGGPQRCRVDYTRDGATRSLWSSGHDYQFCVRKALDIVRLLETVDFQCRPETE